MTDRPKCIINDASIQVLLDMSAETFQDDYAEELEQMIRDRGGRMSLGELVGLLYQVYLRGWKDCTFNVMKHNWEFNMEGWYERASRISRQDDRTSGRIITLHQAESLRPEGRGH